MCGFEMLLVFVQGCLYLSSWKHFLILFQIHVDGLINSVLCPGDSVVQVQKLNQAAVVWIGSGGVIRVGGCPDVLKNIRGKVLGALTVSVTL